MEDFSSENAEKTMLLHCQVIQVQSDANTYMRYVQHNNAVMWKSLTILLSKDITERIAHKYSSTATGKGRSASAGWAAAATGVSVYKTELFRMGPDSTALKTPEELYLLYCC